jgi:hypothetical protein
LPDIAPHWSPTGDRIAYSALAGGVFQLFERPWGGEPRLLLSTAQMKQVTDWSLDGRHLLFRTVTYMPKLDLDIWALPLDPVGTPEPIGRTESDERDAQLSPNGSFVAYQSNAKGRFDIYVKPFKGPGEPEPVSKDGGVQVRWRPDGSALYYIDLMGQLVEVPIRFAPDGRSLKFDTARQLFRANTGPLQGMAQQTYQPYGDGTKFLMDVLVDEVPPPLRVVLNWNRRQAPR